MAEDTHHTSGKGEAGEGTTPRAARATPVVRASNPRASDSGGIDSAGIEPGEVLEGGSHEGATESAEPLSAKRVFTTGEAATICKVSQQTIIRCFDAGRLHGFRVPGSKFRRIPRDELLRFMRGNHIPTTLLDGPDAGPASASRSDRRRVLVVDDEPDIVTLLVEVLSREPRLEVRTAATGYDAGVLTEAFRPELILLDYMLPDINGEVVCRRVRAREDMRACRIICVSGMVTQVEVAQMMGAGADEFIKKPFDIATLLSRVLWHLGMESKAAA
jgi:excisionase family DNA binding protein